MHTTLHIIVENVVLKYYAVSAKLQFLLGYIFGHTLSRAFIVG